MYRLLVVVVSPGHRVDICKQGNTYFPWTKHDEPRLKPSGRRSDHSVSTRIPQRHCVSLSEHFVKLFAASLFTHTVIYYSSGNCLPSLHNVAQAAPFN